MKLMLKVGDATGESSVKDPSISVVAPTVGACVTTTFTPTKGTPFASRTTPFTTCCAMAYGRIPNNKAAASSHLFHVKLFLMIRFLEKVGKNG